MSEENPIHRRPPPPIPVSVLTGFLGSGKTTLLNRLLRDPALADTLVLINEFGEIGLDHLLVERAEGDMILMASGCLCCTIRGDLVSTLEDLLKRRDNNRITPFQRVLIETTGLADPAPVLHTIMFHPYLMLRYRLEGVVTLVDAVNGASTLDGHEESVKQAAVADRLLLSKTDLVKDAAALDALKKRLHALNPAAQMMLVDQATPDNLFNTGLYDAASKTADVARWLNAEAVEKAEHDHHEHDHHEHDHHHHGHDHHHHDHGHDVNRHDARIRAHCLRSDKPLDPRGFDLFLNMLREFHGPSLLRVKGIVALSDDLTRPLVIHGVQHVFHPPVRLETWPDADHSTRIVFILKDLGVDFVEKLWAAFANIAQTDTPDRAAMENNPLAPSRSGGLFS